MLYERISTFRELDPWWYKVLIDPFYPCIKYKSPADPKLDGTDYFIVAESMNIRNSGLKMNLNGWIAEDEFQCSLSFLCENDQKAFYKLEKDCLRFRIHEKILHDYYFDFRLS